MRGILQELFDFAVRPFVRTNFEEYHTHTNPDGSLGGRVANSAQVHPTAHIERFGKVLPGAVVGEGEVIRDGDMLLKDGHKLRFD